MKSMSTGEVREQLATAINRVAFGKERVLITRYGKAVCALVPIEDLTLAQRMDELAAARDERDARVDMEEGGTVSWADLRRRLRER